VETVASAGGTAHYHCLNLLDAAAVAGLINEVEARHGRIDVLIHAAGIEISRSLQEKGAAQFDLVFDVKADGAFNLLRAAAGLPIGTVVAFSSVAGRFGNAGQTDYSAANDLLCKLVSGLPRWRPATRGLAIDWSAWAGIGMATRGSIPKLMELAGIDLVLPEVGVPTVRRELIHPAARGEVVVAGRLGVLEQELDSTGGFEPQITGGLLVARIDAATVQGGWRASACLDPAAQPFLRDHALEGTPLLPGVMGIEAFAQLAACLAPGRTVLAVEKVEFHRPLKFYHRQPQTLRYSAQIRPAADGTLRADTAIRTMRPPARPELPPQDQLHFTASVVLGGAAPQNGAKPAWRPAPEMVKLSIRAAAIYQVYFHGPAYQVLERAGVDGDWAFGLMAASLPPDTVPADTPQCMAPRLIELCFQTAGLWEIATRGRLALPQAVGRVQVFLGPAARAHGRLVALVKATDGGARFQAQVIDERGQVLVVVDDYRTVALPGAAALPAG
jgi:3-hydroxymyristoyl/3-hydroxydecanoyl-(acyl carrier protein) dehydratase